MQEVDLIKLFIERFDKLGESYIVTGSIASIIYGEPRLTHDIDIVIAIKKKSLEKLYEIFPEKEFYIPPIEFLKLEAIRECRGHFNIIHFSSGLKADVYLAGKDEFLNWAINNKNEMNFKGIKLPLAPIEYIIVKNLTNIKRESKKSI